MHTPTRLPVRLTSLLALPVALAACSDSGGSSGTGISGRISAASVDGIWAIPVRRGSFDRAQLQDLIQVPIEEDGSFLFEPPGDAPDYVLALVSSASCSETTPRNEWSEAEIDRRLGCIRGYVTIPEAQASGSMIAIPVSDLIESCELGLIEAPAGGSDEATAETTLEEAADCFELDVDALEAIARTDDMLKAISYHHANTSDDFLHWYAQGLAYRWKARGQLEAARDGFTDPAVLSPEGYGYHYSTSVEPADLISKVGNTPRYLQVVPPGPVRSLNGYYRFGPEDPIVSKAGSINVLIAGSAEGDAARGSLKDPLAGATDGGAWRMRRGGDDAPVTSKFDLAVASPFARVDGELDTTAPIIPVPLLHVVTDGDEVDRLEVKVMVRDESGFVDMDSGIAESTWGAPEIGAFGLGASGCPPRQEEWSGGDVSYQDGVFAWTPGGSWSVDSTCGLHAVVFKYKWSGAEYRFRWEGPDRSFEIRPLSGNRIAFDPVAGPTGGRWGTYVGFDVALLSDAEEWQGADLWVALEDAPAGHEVQAVDFGSEEDGLYHIGSDLVHPAWFYLEWTGVGVPMEGAEHNVTVAAYAGKPPHETVYREVVTLTVSTGGTSASNVVTDATVLDPIVYLGGEGRLEVSGTIAGLGGDGALLFTPASSLGWQADGLELRASEISLYEPGTTTLAENICLDAACDQPQNPLLGNLAAFATDLGPLDYVATFAFRWKIAGQSQFMSPTSWAETNGGWRHTDPQGFSALPVLPPASNATTVVLDCDDGPLSLAAGEPRARCTLSAIHTVAADSMLERIVVRLPEGARVAPATSEQSANHVVRALPDPVVTDRMAEWGTSLVLPAGGDPASSLSFTIVLPQAAGTYNVSATARIGETVIDTTIGTIDSLPTAENIEVVP